MADAYDYENGRWVNGAEGASVLLDQAREELDLISGEKGEEYLRFVGAKQPRAEIVSILQERIRYCERELAAEEDGLAAALMRNGAGR